MNTGKKSPLKPTRRKKKLVSEETAVEQHMKSTARVKKKKSDGSREEKDHNPSLLKIEAFDFFHDMLNNYCGADVFTVLDAASILKQFTPEVIRTVICVITENSKKSSGLESQTLVTENEEYPDSEISKITSKARRKGQRGKWQPVPELVQPRLTSPSSNSCSPVSAAVQALMSFAKTEGQFKKQTEEFTEAEPAELKSEIMIENQAESHEKDLAKANLGVFESDSMTAASNSPFLQPMSSMIMLNSDVAKHGTTDSLSTESDIERQALESNNQSSQASDTSTTNIMSSCFPWTLVATNQEAGQNEKKLVAGDKNLPSISSILSDLSFPLQSTPPLQSAPKDSSILTDSNSGFQASLFQKPQITTPSSSLACLPSNSNLGIVISQATMSSSKRQSRKKPNSKPSTPSNKSKSQISQKKGFRTILPKPVENKPEVKFQIGSEKFTEMSKTDMKLNSPAITSRSLETGSLWSIGRSPVSLDAMVSTSASMQYGNDGNDARILGPKEGVISSIFPKVEECSPDDEVPFAEKPMYIVSRNIPATGINLKNVARAEIIPVVCSKTKKTPTSSSGNLEVASALLSMGSSDTKDKKSAKVVSSFNREKATFEIKESSDAQRGDILFTSTGTFQIEDIEIDPKKNKIDKDSYECGKCGRVFTSLVYLARHIKRVCPDMSLRKWKCDRCDKAFRHPFGLQQHVYTHTGERPYKCDQCAKAFYSANDLRRHKRTHSGERPYSCSHCQKAFSTTISLKTHTYIHTGERPHKCPHCPKTFATSSKLSRHVVTHSDKRPFSCDSCVKTFNRSGDLRRHYNNVHNLEHGLLSCDQCNKLFATQKCLSNHKATHNRDGKHRTISESSSETCGLNFSASPQYTLKSENDG